MEKNRTLWIAVLGVCASTWLNASVYAADTNTTAVLKTLGGQVRTGMSTNDMEKVFGSLGKVRIQGRMTAWFQYAATTGYNALVFCRSISNRFEVDVGGVTFYQVAGDTWNGQVVSMHLSETNVLDIADRLATERLGKYEGFDLQFYPERKPRFDIDGKTWWVGYNRIPNRWVGDHFTVTVDDYTGKAHHSGGL